MIRSSSVLGWVRARAFWRAMTIVVCALILLPRLGAKPLSAQPAQVGPLGEGSHVGTPAEEALPLAYEAALALLEHAPELRARAAASAQLRAAARDVTALPADLTISVEAGPRVHPELKGQGRLGVIQSFALAALGDARRAALSSHASTQDAERAGQRLYRRLQVSQAWLRTHAAHAALGIAQGELQLAETLSQAAERGAELAELTRADAADAAAYAAEAKLGLLSAEGELIEARLDLTRTLAISDRVLDVRGEPPQLHEPTPADKAALHARIETQPALLSLQRQMAALDARKRELRASYASQLSLGVVLDRTDPGAWATLGVVGLTWPLADRGLRERAEVDAERTALRGRTEEQRAGLHVEIERLLHEIEHTHETLQHADERLLPAIERGLSAREALFRAGEGTVLEIVVARRNALGLRLRRLRLHHDFMSALLRFRELSLVVGIAP